MSIYQKRSDFVFSIINISCLPLSGFLGFTPLTNMGVKCFGNSVPLIFSLLFSAKLHSSKHLLFIQNNVT